MKDSKSSLEQELFCRTMYSILLGISFSIHQIKLTLGDLKNFLAKKIVKQVRDASKKSMIKTQNTNYIIYLPSFAFLCSSLSFCKDFSNLDLCSYTTGKKKVKTYLQRIRNSKVKLTSIFKTGRRQFRVLLQLKLKCMHFKFHILGKRWTQ